MPDPSRRARLLALKLASLARDNGGPTDVVPHEYGGGAAFIADGDAWVLLDGDARRGLGPAVAWSLRRGVAHLHLLAESGSGVLARRAPAFRLPITVWHVEDRTLLPAVAEPLPEPADVPPEHDALRGLIVAAGATPVVEHGVLAGEVDGLEVCRAVTDPLTGVARLEVGVGAHDREAFQMLHGDRTTVEALADVVSSVRTHRCPGAAPHPLNLLARERALRDRLVAEPGLIGAAQVVAAQPPTPRANVKDAVPCVAVADLAGGARAAVVCAVGVDLDVVPTAVDVRAATGLDDCVVVLPGRDAIPVQHLLAAALHVPVRVVAVQP